MKRFLFAVAFLLSFQCAAQEHPVPKPVLDDFARDLAEMQSIINQEQNGAVAADAYLSTGVAASASGQAALHSAPSESSAVLATSEQGQQFRVLEKSGPWVRVESMSSAHTSGWVKGNQLGFSYASTQYQDMYSRLTNKAKQFKDRWQNNPYISVTGFTIEIGLPPSVSVEFAFK